MAMKKIFASIVFALLSFNACAVTYTPLSLLAQQAANTVVANVTSASASPTAVAMPSCSTANSALKYALGSGWSCGTAYALTSSTLAQFAATTSAQLAGVVSDETGSGPLVFATAPTITLPNATGLPISTGVSGMGTGVAAGLASAVTGSGGVVLATTPTITTPNIVGVTNGSSAAAGSVGEQPTAAVGTAVSLTTSAQANCTSKTLTAGMYLLYGSISFNPAGSTVMSAASAGISTTTGAVPAVPLYTSWGGTATAGVTEIFPVPMQIVNPNVSTTYFLVGVAIFTTSTATMTCQLNALRIR